MQLLSVAVGFALMAATATVALGQGAQDRYSCILEKVSVDGADATIASCTRMIDGGGIGGRALVWLYLTRSAAHAFKNDHRLSIADATKAIEINPMDGMAYSFRGGGYVELAEYDRAIDDFTKLIELGHSELGYTARADAYSKKGEHDRAIADATKATELAPKTPASYTNRAWILLRAGEAAQGLLDVNRAFELSREAYHHNFYTRAQLLEALGRPQEAIADYRQALSLVPDHKGYQNALKRLGVEP